jgi:flagella basal body P-ring formation protein FlgA
MKRIYLTLMLAIILAGVTAQASFIVSPQENIFDETSVISIERFERDIVAILQEKGVPGERISVDLQGHSKGIQLNNFDKRYSVRLIDFELIANAKRFEANYRFTPQEKLSKPEDVTIRGRFDTFSTVPVLTASKGRGSIIHEDDLTYIEMSSRELKRGVLTDADQIIGKQLKSQLSSLKPLRKYQLIEPRIIERNDAVDIVFSTPTLELRTLGTAMEDGGKSEVIKVRNNTSGKVIQAQVIGSNLVKAQRNTLQSAALNGVR